jgi:hypothetical protein
VTLRAARRRPTIPAPRAAPGARGPRVRRGAERAWAWALSERLPWFGPFEDALSSRSTGLFHTRISALVNLHRLLPARVVADVARVHAATDGMQAGPDPLGRGDGAPLPPRVRDAVFGGRTLGPGDL